MSVLGLLMGGLAALPNATTLATCEPRDQQGIVVCLDNVLSAEERAELLATDYLDLSNGFSEFAGEIERAWLDPEGSLLGDDFARARFPMGVKLGSEVLRTYWLASHRCPLDLAKRALYRWQVQEVARLVEADRTALESASDEDPDMISDPPTYAVRMYVPNCPGAAQ